MLGLVNNAMDNHYLFFSFFLPCTIVVSHTQKPAPNDKQGKNRIFPGTTWNSGL